MRASRGMNNYLKHGEVDVSEYQAMFSTNVPWDNEYSQTRMNAFEVHNHVYVLPLMWSMQNLSEEPNVDAPKTEFYNDYYKDKFFNAVSKVMGNNGKFVRALFTNLPAGAKIMPHVDAGVSLGSNKRVHIPIISNPDVIFTVGGEDRYIQAGEVVEINNSVLHSVKNLSSKDRIHLILDWYSNESL